MSKQRNSAPQRKVEQPVLQPTVQFRKCSIFTRTMSRYSTDRRVIKALKEFVKLKMSNPLERFGSKDTLFAPRTPLEGYIHCGLTHDVSVVYKMHSRNPTIIDLYFIGTHDELGTGNPPSNKRMYVHKKSWDNQEMEPIEFTFDSAILDNTRIIQS